MPGEKFEGLGITTIMHFTAVLRRVACQGSSLWKGRESNSLFGAALPLASRGLFTWRADDGDCWSRRCTLLFSPLENSAWMRNYSSRKFIGASVGSFLWAEAECGYCDVTGMGFTYLFELKENTAVSVIAVWFLFLSFMTFFLWFFLSLILSFFLASFIFSFILSRGGLGKPHHGVASWSTHRVLDARLAWPVNWPFSLAPSQTKWNSLWLLSRQCKVTMVLLSN